MLWQTMSRFFSCFHSLCRCFYGWHVQVTCQLFLWLCRAFFVPLHRWSTKAQPIGMIKAIRTTFFALLTVAALCACSKDEESGEPAKGARYIKVDVLESLAPKGSEYYNPKAYTPATTMLFAVPAATLAGVQPKLADGIAVQQGGKEVAAAYTSSIGYIAGAEFGTYTLLVYCTSNPLNGYLSGRYTYKPLEYTASNYQYEGKCLFVWEDMSTDGGYFAWETP